MKAKFTETNCFVASNSQLNCTHEEEEKEGYL